MKFRQSISQVNMSQLITFSEHLFSNIHRLPSQSPSAWLTHWVHSASSIVLFYRCLPAVVTGTTISPHHLSTINRQQGASNRIATITNPLESRAWSTCLDYCLLDIHLLSSGGLLHLVATLWNTCVDPVQYYSLVSLIRINHSSHDLSVLTFIP